MELLSGLALHELAAEAGALSAVEPLRATRIMHQVCQALAAAHSCGVVHRDLTPANVFVLPDGDGERVVLVDFGSASMPDADADVSDAWSFTQGSPDTVIAIIDSGVDLSHPDLLPNFWSNPDEIAANGIETPLGILTLGQIEKGEQILLELYEVFQKKKKNRSEMERLTGEFYTAIPHRIGRTRAAVDTAVIETLDRSDVVPDAILSSVAQLPDWLERSLT